MNLLIIISITIVAIPMFALRLPRHHGEEAVAQITLLYSNTQYDQICYNIIHI